MPDGAVTRVDLHVKVLDGTVVSRAKRAGLDVLVYAPHFTHLSAIRERAREYSDDDLLVVPARECFTGDWTQRRHVLVVDPSEPIPDFLTFEGTMAELEKRGETVLAPHPEFLTMSLAREDIHEYRHVFDAVEVFCPKNWSIHTRRMRDVAAETGLPTYTSSYAHLRSTVGEAWTAFEQPIDTAEELRSALESGAESRCCRKSGVDHLLARRAEFAHLFKENTWEKFRRVVFKRPEPTNPRNSLYDGEYGDHSAY